MSAARLGESRREVARELDAPGLPSVNAGQTARDTSVSALVKQFLNELAQEESETERLTREEAELRASIRSFRASDRLSRDNIHGRGT